ncbi:MAG: hypothetical protein LBC30_00970 [Puniceicoccales bacterium]|jgi:hypothetical protein|nr:hypothetical protein [Puniceicoccales bacterium]
MPGVSLKVRSVEVGSEFVDEDAVNASQATSGPKPQNLKVDALFRVDVADVRRSGLPQTRSGALMSNPALILAEMQVGQQHFGARLMSYASKILARLPIDVEHGVIPQPVYAIAFCMWQCDQLVKRCVVKSDELDAATTDRFTETGYASVFLGKLIKVKNKDRATLDTDLLTGQTALKGKVAVFFGKENWETLELDEKKVYLWLEFLSFAHLMTEEHKNASLACLGGDLQAEEAKEVFREAYDTVRIINFEGATMEQIERNYPDIYGYEEAQLKCTKAETEKGQAQAMVESLLGFAVKELQSNADDPQRFNGVISQIEPNLWRPVYKRPVDRHTNSMVLGLLKQRIKTHEKEKVELILREVERAFREFSSLEEGSRALIGFQEILDVSQDVGKVPLEKLRTLLQTLTTAQNGANLALEVQTSSCAKVEELLHQEPLRFYIQAVGGIPETERDALATLDVPEESFNEKLTIWNDDPETAWERMIEEYNSKREEEEEEGGVKELNLQAWRKAALVSFMTLTESSNELLLSILDKSDRVKEALDNVQRALDGANRRVLEVVENIETQMQQLASFSPKSPRFSQMGVFQSPLGRGTSRRTRESPTDGEF